MGIDFNPSRLYEPCVTVANHPLGEFHAAMQSYPIFHKTRTVEPFQGRKRSTMFVLNNQIDAMLLSCKIDFFGSNADRTVAQSNFEALFQGLEPVMIDITDGFFYRAVLLSSAPSSTVAEMITTVDYEFRVTRHTEQITVPLESSNKIYCASNTQQTDCIITVDAGYFGGEDDADLSMVIYLNDFHWTVMGSDNPNNERIVLDGINKRFLIGDGNAAKKITWTDFPYLKPGINTMSVYVAGVPVELVGSVVYLPTYV